MLQFVFKTIRRLTIASALLGALACVYWAGYYVGYSHARSEIYIKFPAFRAADSDT
jgi:hypothetical protein